MPTLPHCRRRLLPGALAVLAVAPLPAIALAAPPPALESRVQGPSARTPIGLLLDRAEFWYEHGQEDVALQTYQRVLGYEPDNIDAMIGAARMALVVGQTGLAKQYIDRLHTLAPSDPAVVELTATSGRTQQQVGILTEARHLAAGAKREEALAKYRDLFNDHKTPPDDLAGEYYYLALQDMTDGSVEAEDVVDKMTAIADHHPGEIAYQLALAHCLTLLGDHRPDAIDMYAKLAREPTLTNRIRPLWREAILWSGIDIRAREQLLDYLSMFPSDPDLDAVQAKMKHDLPSRAQMAILLGNTQMEDGKLKEAEESFRKGMALDPQEVQGPVMMAVLMMKENRNAEARDYAHKGADIMPGKRDEILAIVGEGKATAGAADPEAARAIQAQYREINRLIEAGQLTDAEALLAKATGGKTEQNAGSLMILAEIRRRSGDDATSLAMLQRALAIAPKNADVLLSLCSAQIAAGQLDTAQASYARAAAALGPSAPADKQRYLRRLNGELLRQNALAEPDPARRLQMLADALGKDPANRWTRLELARALEAQSRSADAAEAIAPVLAEAAAPGANGREEGIEAIHVAYVWFDSHNAHPSALRLALLLPEAKRSNAMRYALDDEALKREIAQHLGDGDIVRRLLGDARRPDPDGSRGLIIGRTLVRVSGVAAMRQALTLGLNATPAPADIARLNYAGLLIDNHQFGAARALLAAIDWRALATDQRRAFAQAGDYLAAAEVEQWLQARKIAEAQATLAARGRRIAGSVILQTAAARIVMASGRPLQALDTLQRLLDRDPSDANVRAAAIDAAVAAQKMDLARVLADDGQRLNPDNPFIALQAANIARQQGRDVEALDDLRRARALRIEDMQRDLPLESAAVR
jgi:cellulose synthase operon protein C